MPIYEYHCKKCDKTYETIQKVDTPPTLECENCEGLAERVMSSFSVRCKESQTDNYNRFNWKNGRVIPDAKWAREIAREKKLKKLENGHP